MPPNRDEVIERLTVKLPTLLAKTPVVLAYLYGSVAMDQATATSDVDLALILREDNNLAPYELLHLQLGLSVDLSRETGIPEFDVRAINDLPLALRGHVACHGIPVYVADEETRIAFETRTRDEYFDYQPIADRLRRAYFADLRERGLNV